MGSQGGAGRGVASSLAPPLPPPEADFSEFTYTTNTTPTRPDPTSFDSSRPHLRAATGRTQEVTAVVVAMSKNCRDRPSGNDVLAMHPGHVYELHGGSTPVTSVLKSPFITVENTKCVGFYYWIGGTENASLTVSVEKNDGTSVSESLQLVKMAEPGWRVVEMGRHRYYGEQMKLLDLMGALHTSAGQLATVNHHYSTTTTTIPTTATTTLDVESHIMPSPARHHRALL